MTKKYFILVWGCQMNSADAEKVEAILSQLGYRKTAEEKSADLIVAVACSIRQSAINRLYGQACNWQKRRKQGRLLTILTGCVLPKDKNKLAKIFDLVLEVKDINLIPQELTKLKILNIKDYFHINPRRQSNFQAYVPIMTGCNNFCSYCVVPYVRGQEISRPAKEIIKECRDLIKSGYKEITLLGQNVNSYHSNLPLPAGEMARSDRGGGRSQLWDFPELLKTIDKIPGDYWLRFLTSHPKDLSDQLIEVMAQGQHLTPYLHLAVQSGDNGILKKMNRHYTVKYFKSLVKKAKQARPELMISTDAIVGFPTETKKQFQQTVKLFKAIGFDMAYIAKYSPRPQTSAAKMIDDIPLAEKIRRQKALNDILEKTALKNNKKLLGQTVRVLVENYKNGQVSGKTATFKTVIFTGAKSLVGRFVEVKITQAGSWTLKGELIESNQSPTPKLIVILGPTATGKTKMAAKLAAKFNGEIVSADSRQNYQGLDIGTGKDLDDYVVKTKKPKSQKAKKQKIKYHLIDIVNPKHEFNVAQYQKLAYQAIDDILKRGKIPFLVGGTGLYIEAVIKGYQFPPVKNPKSKIKSLREKLNKSTLAQLLLQLKKIDPVIYQIIDRKNRRRVQRALEIYFLTGRPKSKQLAFKKPAYDILLLGLYPVKLRLKYTYTQNGKIFNRVNFPLEKIYQKIDTRLKKRLGEGMIEEVKRLKSRGVSYKRLDDLGLEYRYLARYLKGDIDYQTLVNDLKNAIHHFAKRQLTWFKRNRDISWLENYQIAEKKIKKFLNN